MVEYNFGGDKMNYLECYNVKNNNLIKESYEVNGKRITINISKEKFDDLLYSFIELLEEPCFFILEVPLTLQEEKEKQVNNFDSFHYQIYYIDGLTKEKLKIIFNNYLIFFKNNGLVSFGVASHISHDEIFFTKYNVANIYSNKIQNFFDILSTLDIPQTNNLITAWNIFNQNTPGEAFDLNEKEDDIASFINYATKTLGMYKGEIR